MEDRQNAWPQAGPHDPLVAEQSHPTIHTPWTDALRPFSFDAVEAPLWLRIWQQFCVYVPALILSLWCLLLALQLYWQPIYCVATCNIHLCWCILDQARIWIYGERVLKKVLAGIDKAGESYMETAVSEDGAHGLHHVVFICAYKENVEVLRETLRSIAIQKGSCNGETYAMGSIGVCLCMEAREGADAESTANKLMQEFRDQFEWMEVSYHPDKLAGEVQGKCSNLQWAVTQSSRLGTNCLVTCADADSMFDPLYFSAVSARYVELGAAGNSLVFQPTIAHFLNYFEQISIVRGSSVFVTMCLVGNIEDPMLSILPYSTFTVSSDFVRRLRGWDADYLNDDWHTGTKAFVAEPLLTEIVHIPHPVVNCAVEAETYLGAFWARWKQACRHALGVEELIYLLQMVPVCHQKVQKKLYLGETEEGGGLISMYARFTRMFLYLMSLHIRLVLTLPSGAAMGIIVIGMCKHFPLYGEALLTSYSFRLNMCLGPVLAIIVLGESFIGVRLVQHLLAAGRIRLEGKLPWWAHTPIIHFIHHTVSTAFAMPVVVFAASLASTIACFKVPFWNKQSFEFYVAPKIGERRLDGLEPKSELIRTVESGIASDPARFGGA